MSYICINGKMELNQINNNENNSQKQNRSGESNIQQQH